MPLRIAISSANSPPPATGRGLVSSPIAPPEIAVTTPDVWEQNRTYYRELLTQYGPTAGIWQDGIGRYYPQPQSYTGLDRNYAMMRTLQPQCLISFKNGATGEEDFLAPEHTFTPSRGKQSPEAWEKLKDKPVEICTTMQLGRGLWMNNESAKHMTAADVMAEIKSVTSRGYNLLLNTGLRGDGSVHPADVQALREAGARLKMEGFPTAVRPATRPNDAPAPQADKKRKPRHSSLSKSAE